LTDLLPFSAVSANANAFPTPPPYSPVTTTSIQNEIGLIQEFFLAKLAVNNDNPLVEDDDLPPKSRLPKPRLPPTGKISSPRKKPVREPGPGKGHPKKKMRQLEDGGWVKESEFVEMEREKKEREANAGKVTAGSVTGKEGSKLKHQVSVNEMERSASRDEEDAEEDGEDNLALGKNKRNIGQEKKINGANGGMISPESLEAS
jgi:hypothetical protein